MSTKSSGTDFYYPVLLIAWEWITKDMMSHFFAAGRIEFITYIVSI